MQGSLAIIVLVTALDKASLEAADVTKRVLEQLRVIRSIEVSLVIQNNTHDSSEQTNKVNEIVQAANNLSVGRFLIVDGRTEVDHCIGGVQPERLRRPKDERWKEVKLDASNPLAWVEGLTKFLRDSLNLDAEADALESALRRTTDPKELIGSNMMPGTCGGTTPVQVFYDEVLCQFTRFLEAVNSSERATIVYGDILEQPKLVRRPLSLVEKILTHHAIGLTRPEVRPGEMICVSVDWTLTSELLWAGMDKTYTAMNRPRIHRNDRVWLAVDHTVDPRTNHQSRQKALIHKAEQFRDEAKLIDFLPANTSIMHTDFTRERAQPGYLVVGSDSHTCSAGSMGAFAVGFGAVDVVMPMVTGETWLRVPEVCRINFVGNLPYGISGKDVILHILGHLKRNTIAFQRAVEYGGPGLAELSMDARFAIANMTTEFGGMGACFESDQRTVAYLAGRRLRRDKDRALYFKPDPDAQYAEIRTIDLSEVQITMALYPNPDSVVEICTKAGMKLDGCFIGACTTTEEELIMAGLVLEAGLAAGLKPSRRGKRRVTPGSLTITCKLEKLGLLEVYRMAGFDVGAPGCSYCVGINDIDVAQSGEVWLSSQNRNFRNRMGQGSIGNITCAAAVAASSFHMEVTDPKPLLLNIDSEIYKSLLGWDESALQTSPVFREPATRLQTKSLFTSTKELPIPGGHSPEMHTIEARIQRFEDNVDTDAVIPAQFMPGKDDADLGKHCFEFARPQFREKAVNGATVIVAGHGFGSGSSREDAVRALKGIGVQMVIARSFAFIYERNQLNMGLFNARICDDDFYDHAIEGAVLSVDKATRTLRIAGVDRSWEYEHSALETELLQGGGLLPSYQLYGNAVFRELIHSRQTPEIKLKAAKDLSETPRLTKEQTALAW